MKILPLLLLLPIGVVPAGAQSRRVYTNADLTPHPVTTWTRTVTPDELDALRQHQYQAPATATRDLGPWVSVVPYDPAWPFRSSTPDTMTPTRPLSEPWSMTTYLGRSYGSGVRRAPQHQPIPRPCTRCTITSTSAITAKT